jgi:superfamily II DNA or RNA helicase
LVTNAISVSKGKLTEYKFSKESDYAEKCFLSNQAAWPTAKQMNLDDSQYNAIRLALENKLALIQGPPGTGKTFIGVKLVQLLMNNKHTWWNRPTERHRPILMICYTVGI